jgi:hypothetical protein
MSHAPLIVAVSPDQLAEHGTLEKAIAWLMAPFDEDEQGGWFADGSRWDWYVIGGRFTGKFAPDYEPRADTANYKTCDLCGGTGTRPDMNMDYPHREPSAAGHPVIGRGCNGCLGTGWDMKHPGEWRTLGNVCKRSDLDEASLKAGQRVQAEQHWAQYQADRHKELWNFPEGETLESLTASYEQCPLAAYAFLRDRRWHEQGRMGWFGREAATECELKADEEGKEFVGRCLHKCEKTGAEIVSWSESGRAKDDRWNRLYWARFVRNLPGETTLAICDYHV